MSDERFPGVIEDDPEYDGDAAADVDAEDFGFEPADPNDPTPDLGDPGQPRAEGQE
ncbi:MAG TPA: hypothetical protein VNT55_12965 [Baekduia sp.]|nr:hypothetical protein [Baekduia sp.]